LNKERLQDILFSDNPTSFSLCEVILNAHFEYQEIAWGMLTQRRGISLVLQYLLRNADDKWKVRVARFILSNNPSVIELREVEKSGVLNTDGILDRAYFGSGM